MPNCSVRGCSNKSGHLFPKNNPTLKRKWLKFAGLTEGNINIHSLICKIHFAENAFDQHQPIPGLPPPRKRLKANAVPTLFPNLLKVQPMIIPHKKPTKSVVYDVIASTSTNKVCLAEVDLSRALVFSEKQLARVIERIKDKLRNNAHSSAVFPRKWQNSSLFAGTPKIREGYPPFSMPCLVTLAIEANVRRMATPSQIVGFISQNFPCYKLTDPSWHGRVFETLQTYKLFQKVPSSMSDNPKKTFYYFAPDRRTVMSPEVYEAFTDPFFDESKLDLSHAVISTAADNLFESGSEDIEESHMNEFDDYLKSFISDDEAATVSVDDVSAERQYEHPDSNKRAKLIAEDEEKDADLESDGSSSSDEESVTFLECSYCEFVAASAKTISTHVLQKHWTGENYGCSQCSYVTPAKRKLMVHKASHKK